MWNGQFDALQRPNRAVPDRGSLLKNNQFAVLNNVLSVVGVFRTSCMFETLKLILVENIEQLIANDVYIY